MMEIITVSEKARIQIQKLLEEQKLDKETHFLRVGVKGGGCSGLSYELGFDNIPQVGDNVIEDNSTKIDKIGYLNSNLQGDCDYFLITEPDYSMWSFANRVSLWNTPGRENEYTVDGQGVKFNVEGTCTSVRVVIQRQQGDWYEVMVSDKRPEYSTPAYGWVNEDFVLFN